GRLVLAEASRLEVIGRGLRTEERLVVLCAEVDLGLGEEDVIPRVRVRVADYLTAAPGGRHRSLVIRHATGATDEHPAGDWVAFNPALAQSLGWSIAPQGLFLWRDPQGQVMVESLWWLDGPLGRRGMSARNCVGEGWLVVAAPAAMHSIATHEPGLRRVLLARRSVTLESGDETIKSARQESPI